MADRKAFVTLRFAGDDLDPQEISAILPVKPTRAHKMGEEFLAGPNAGTLRGRTGIWFLATDKLVPSDDLAEHLEFVQRLLYPESVDKRRIAKVRDVLERANSHAHIACFWRGNPGDTPPQIPDGFRSALEPLAADIETDFAQTEMHNPRRPSPLKTRGSAVETIGDLARALEEIDLSDPPSTAAQWQLISHVSKGLDIIFAPSRSPPPLREIEGLDVAVGFLETSASGSAEAARDELVRALTGAAEVGVKIEDEAKLRQMGKQHFADRIQKLKSKLPTL